MKARRWKSYNHVINDVAIENRSQRLNISLVWHAQQRGFVCQVRTIIKETDDPVTSESGFDRSQIPQLYRAVATARGEPQPLGTLEEYQASDPVGRLSGIR